MRAYKSSREGVAAARGVVNGQPDAAAALLPVILFNTVLICMYVCMHIYIYICICHALIQTYIMPDLYLKQMSSLLLIQHLATLNVTFMPDAAAARLPVIGDTYLSLCMYVCIYICICMCIYIYIYMYIYIYIYVYLSLSLSLSIYIYVYTYMCIYIYI